MMSPPFRHRAVMARQGPRRYVASLASGVEIRASKAGAGRSGSPRVPLTSVRWRLGSSSPQALFDRMNQLAEATQRVLFPFELVFL